MSELTYKNKFVYDSPPPKPAPTEFDNILLGVFMDGTKNNKNNTDSRRGNTQAYKDHGTNDTDNSYLNDYSNVARLWEFYEPTKRIYIDGIGTKTGSGDEMMGFAFGSGATGIREKVRIACEEVVKKIKILSNKKNIEVLTFDVFGFSRGSAAARNFVYEVNKAAYAAKPIYHQRSGTVIGYADADGKTASEKNLPANGHLGVHLKKAGIKVDHIVIRFLGIFDTVSSFHPNISASPNFANDVQELHLNDISVCNKIVHFSAADEHRENFSLTNINSTGGANKPHIEKSLPGVHSDIGGSYLDNIVEVVDELSYTGFGTEELEQERQRVIEEGWYRDSQITLHQRNFKYNKLTGRRRLSNKYSFIPLHFMCTYAVTYRRPLPFKQGPLENKYSINNVVIQNNGVSVVPNNFLIGIKSRLRKFVFEGGPPLVYKSWASLEKTYKGSKIPEQRHANFLAEKKEQENIRLLRNNFLHWSARYEGIGMNPNIENGRRRRIIYNG
jgi:Uncharacterized alpha/beta hydrolase domain (DUF2235)